MSERSQLALCGESTFPPEELDDEETFFDIMKKATLHSNQSDIIDNMQTPEFKNTYRELINDIKQCSFNDQRRFIEKVLLKIKELYDFEFPIKIDITNLNNIVELYQFLEFLEFDNTDFFIRVWKYLDKDLRNLDIRDFCFTNESLIIEVVEEQLQSYDFNEYINIFLRTYYKDRFVEWFIRQTKNSKVEIMISYIQ